jgi:hypothetical protein
MNVVIGLLSDDRMELEFVRSLTTLLRARHDDFEGRVIIKQGYPGNFDLGRNAVVGAFLETEGEWLLQIDSDETFTPTDWDHMVEVAGRGNRLVSGLYFKASDPPQPLMVKWDWEADRFRAVRDWTSGEAIEVDAVPSGFLLTHRSVFEKMLDVNYEDPRPWYKQNGIGWGDAVTECDYYFCYRAARIGYPPVVATATRIGHIKPHVINIDTYRKGND